MRANCAHILSHLPKGTHLFAVVKAGGYGHGAVPVARAALDGGATGLAVATLEEARELEGLTRAEHVLVMGGLTPAQARSASSIIVALPIAFLLILSTLHSPYLDAFHQPAGEMFLLAMLGVMAAGYVWMRRLLDLPGLQRVRLTDA